MGKKSSYTAVDDSHSDWLDAVNASLTAWGEAPVNVHETRYCWVEVYLPSEAALWVKTRRGDVDA